MSQKQAAAYHGSGACQKSCCWTPYGTCARNWTCEHHREEAHAQSRRDWAEQFATELRESAASSKRISDFAPWR